MDKKVLVLLVVAARLAW